MNDSYSNERRTFLKTLAVFSSAAATLVTTKKADAAPRNKLPKTAPTANGYQETEHIRAYYRTARN